MGLFTKGDIVIFPFPYTDLSNTKLRPCLIISDLMNEEYILCQITSQKIKKDNYCIEIKKTDTLNGFLYVDSFVRCNMIFTANKNQILKKICSIKNNKYKEVFSVIKKIIEK